MVPLPIHSGDHLAEELRELGMSAAELAQRLDLRASRVKSLLNGGQPITADMSRRLALFFGTSAEFWLNLQKLHEVRLAERS